MKLSLTGPRFLVPLTNDVTVSLQLGEKGGLSAVCFLNTAFSLCGGGQSQSEI